MADTTVTRKQIAQHLRANGMGCNCDLDNWEPEASTGHSWVCRIHKAAMSASPELVAEVEAAVKPMAGTAFAEAQAILDDCGKAFAAIRRDIIEAARQVAKAEQRRLTLRRQAMRKGRPGWKQGGGR